MEVNVLKLAVVGSGILLVDVMWFHFVCFGLKVSRVAQQISFFPRSVSHMICILPDMLQISA